MNGTGFLIKYYFISNNFDVTSFSYSWIAQLNIKKLRKKSFNNQIASVNDTFYVVPR